MSAFKAYDIRGVYNKDFNKEDVYRIGFYLPELLKADKVLVGRDVRVSSPEIFEHLVRGINDAGADVYDLGISTTPMVYYFTAKHHFRASVQITASHNPKEYNGLKVSREEALPVGFDSGLGDLQKLVEAKSVIVPVENRGKVVDYKVIQEYIDFQKSYLKDISNLNIAIDCSNGMGALLAKDVYGMAPHYLYDIMDGTFPNHEPNPLEEENVEDLKHLVLKEKCDVGVIFDGDADRVMFVDDLGRFIRPDLMIAVLAEYFIKEKGRKGNVLQDIRTSKSVSEYITKLGSTMHMWRVGRAYAALKLREIDGIFGGELAGHYYFKDFYYSDSGVLAATLILGIVADLKRNHKTLSALIDEIDTYANSGELNFKISQKAEAMEAIREFFTAQEPTVAFFDFDGYRIEFNDWWFNIRPSNTEPYLRFIAEAKTKELLADKIAIAERIIRKFE